MSITRTFAHIPLLRIGLFALPLLFFAPISGSLFNLNIAQATLVSIPSSNICDGFDWSNGQNNKGLFDNPTFMENIFSFTIENFCADSSSGKSDFISDSLQLNILAENELSWHLSERKDVCVPDSEVYACK